MQKSLKVLEKNVEWIALGLGAMWVLWVIWAYWICSPVNKEIGGKTVTPATIDSELIDPEAKQLANRLRQPAPKELKPIELAFSMKQPVPDPLTAVAIDSRPAVAMRKSQQAPPEQIQQPVAEQGNLKVLPKAVIPVPIITLADHMQVVMPPGPAPAAPAPGLAPAAPAPVIPVAGGLNGIPKDIRNATAFFWFNIKLQDAEFAKAGIPAPAAGGLRPFFAVEVTLQRQEIGPDGKDIGAPVGIPILPNRTPAPDRTPANLPQFIQWVATPQAQDEILNPPFLQCMGNANWQGINPQTGQPIPKVVQPVVMPNAPIDPLANAPGIGANPFDAQSALAFYNTLAPADQKAYKAKLKYADKSALEKAESDAKRQARPSGRPARDAAGGRTGRGDAQDPTLFNELYAQATNGQNPPPGRDTRPDWLKNPYGNLPSAGRPGSRPGRPGRSTYPQPGVVQPGVVQPQLIQPGMQPGALLQPNQNGDIVVFAHDITGEAGKTYKYRIKLVIMNPLYQDPTAAANVAKVFELDAQFSDWTKPVTLPNDVELFFAGADKKDAAKFIVQRWQNGQINPSPTITANPGDSVGYLDKATSIDYTTGWMVADIDPSGARVTLINANGQTMVRTEKEDKAKLNPPTPAPAADPAATSAAVPPVVPPGRPNY